MNNSTFSPTEGLEQLRTINHADVYKAGHRAATLQRTPHGIEFRYCNEWVAASKAPIASTLPVHSQPVRRPAGELPAYFAGLLPEGRRLGVLRRAVKTSADDELSLLLAVGADTIGDIQVVPVGHSPTDVPAQVVIDNLAEVSFTQLLDELGIKAQRSGLPGVQDKTSAAMINLPATAAGEHNILKLNPIGQYPHLVENEAFFLHWAHTCGISVPQSTCVTDRDAVPGLLICRFDRLTVEGRLVRLAVEDGAQACDRPPADKYRLGVDSVFRALANLCDAPVMAGRELIRQLVFAYLTGNGDAHAKNFSVLQDASGEWVVSPAYDLPCSYLYGDTTMALPLSGRLGSDYSGSDFVALGGRLGVPERAVRRILTDLAQRCDPTVQNLNELPFDRGLLSKLRRVMNHRRNRLMQ